MNKTNWARMCLALLLLIFSFNVSAQKRLRILFFQGFILILLFVGWRMTITW